MNLKLKYAIIRSGRHQFEIANDSNISEVRLSKIINGRIDPSPLEREKISDALGIPVRDLFDEVLGNRNSS